MRLSWNEARARAAAFAEGWKDAAYEKGETQSFYNAFFDVFGVRRRNVARYEAHVAKLDNRSGFIDLFWPGVLLVEQKSAGRDLKAAYARAGEYFDALPDRKRPRYILVSDFQTFELHDLDERQVVAFALADLPAHVEAFGFILGVQRRTFRDQDPANIEAAELVGRLHDSLADAGHRGQPFVKWAGGKRSLVPTLAPHFPDQIGTYWEPFVGGGAVFFAFARRIDRAILSDTNEELVLTYQVVKNDVEALIGQLWQHKRKHEERAGQTYEDGKTYYLRVRDAAPSDPIEIAARFIYLNKTCYNGLYRVNSKGKFNVPEGRYKNPDICNVDRLREASQALQNATIRVGDFASIVQPGRSDLVYCDPPYDGVFTSYQASGFGGSDQERLRNAANGWMRSGARVVLSNADTPAMRKLYSDFQIHEATAPRPINSKSTDRGNAAELIITSE